MRRELKFAKNLRDFERIKSICELANQVEELEIERPRKFSTSNPNLTDPETNTLKELQEACLKTQNSLIDIEEMLEETAVELQSTKTQNNELIPKLRNLVANHNALANQM
ncbi:hypothetical protein Ciccas_000745 [Cichlidogyrus casuarinus]|uniref:GAT domain-containing protein n=1 Tax=Cichlidogyrus casuarinus TaxID=1844966 RepID=A0ABD2QM19_9PLAT